MCVSLSLSSLVAAPKTLRELLLSPVTYLVQFQSIVSHIASELQVSKKFPSISDSALDLINASEKNAAKTLENVRPTRVCL